MNAEPLRISGAIVSALVIAAALFLALRTEDVPAAAMLMSEPFVQSSAAAPAPLAFAVRFRGDGPIARAQEMAGRGSERRAARRIAAELGRQPAFDGLCFNGFTNHAAEVVLTSCVEIASEDRAQVQTRWLASLNRMPAVEYANLALGTREM